MRNILGIYIRDIRNIISNWVALVIVVGLLFLPAFYAWFNIESAWDPYGNTQQILVAVVNNDKQAEFKGHIISVGNDIVKELKANKNIGWKFVDSKEAEMGVKYGKYYASITIPKDFSKKIISITEDVPQKAELIYSVNEKRNAVAPKITQKGVSSIQQEVNVTFIQTISNITFGYFNKFGLELEEGKPELKSFIDMIIDIDSKMPQINKSVDDAYNGTAALQNFNKSIQSDIPVFGDTVKRTSDMIKTTKGFLVKTRDSLRSLSPLIREQLAATRDLSSMANSSIAGISDFASSDADRAKNSLIAMRGKYSDAVNKINNVESFISMLNNVSRNSVLEALVNRLQSIKDKMNTQIQFIDSVTQAIDRGQKVSADKINNIVQGSKQITGLLDDTVNDYDAEIAPAVDDTANNSVIVADNTLKLLQDIESNLPMVNDILQIANTGTALELQNINDIKSRMPAVEKSIHTLAERLRSFDDDQKINEIIKILKRDAKKEGDFLANPIDIKENRIFPIPNYGSGMSPFFTTLSLWVGALILGSILSIKVHPFNGIPVTTNEEYIGRYLTFVSITVLQAVVVTLGDIFLLKAYVASPVVFILFAVYISIIFTMIVYTLVSVLGNVGKALAMVLMVLQISASGGTFPIEVTPPFFQHLNPLLPFTYAVGGMREAVGGILWDLLLYNVLMLSIYFVISILFGILMKKKFNRINARFVEKFKTSGLVEE